MAFSGRKVMMHALIVVMLVCFPFTHGVSKLKFCLNGPHELVSERFTHNQPSTIAETSADIAAPLRVGCPGGLLFNQPVGLAGLTSHNNETFCVKHSICDRSWKCGTKKQSLKAQVLKLGKPTKTETWKLVKDDDSIDTNIPECMPPKIAIDNSDENQNEHIYSSRKKREITGLVPSERTSNEEIQKEVDDQTKRMFYYLTGINQDQVNSHLRVVKLYKMSTQLVSMICDPTFINPKFLQEIEKGFLFLLKEQGFDKLVDIDLDSYNQLKLFLENCATNVTMVKFFGTSCPTRTVVHQVYTLDGPQAQIKSIHYAPDEKTFKWGEYDIVLDAAWSVMNIVHGGCFEFFSRNVNLHHKFQVALEQLFHAALYLRWEHPTQLSDDTFYDSIFMTRVNDTLKAMDGCVRYLYLLTPFKVQLNRPIHETFYRRKKRSTSDEEEDEQIRRMFSSQENSVDNSNESPTNTDYESFAKDDFEAYCIPSDDEMNAEIESRREKLKC